MADSRKVVKVFLGSPGDLQEERRAAKDVVDEWNKQWADNLGYHIELIGWEDTVAGFGRPQELINQDLDRCEVFIGMMWKRWGTAPAKTGPYSSGFEEEFERSVKSRRENGRPEISLLFKEVDPELLKDPGEDLKKVLIFKENLGSEKEILYETFRSSREFDAKIRGCITNYIQNLQAKEAEIAADETQTRPTEEPDTKSPIPASPFSEEGAAFVRSLLEKEKRDVNGALPREVARFRLLGLMLWAPGNDRLTLGVHDANILFEKHNEIELSTNEKGALLDSGLDNFSAENVPVWHWYSELQGYEHRVLVLNSIFGPPQERIGALRAMRLIAEPVEDDEDRSGLLKSWLGDGADRSRKVAALAYLSTCGVSNDLPAIKEEFERGNYQTTNPAVDAIIRINLRESREKALKALYELQPESIDQHLIEALFARPQTIPTLLLEEGIAHRSPEVRRTIVSLLVARKALKADAAERLLSDAEASIRYLALYSLLVGAKPVSEEDAKRILIKRVPTRGLLSLAIGPTNYVGEAEYERFKRDRFVHMPLSDLEAIAKAAYIFDQSARFILDERLFGKRGKALREAVDDRFHRDLKTHLEEISKKFGIESDIVIRAKALENHLQKELCRKGLDVLCRKDFAEDIQRIRLLLNSDLISPSIDDVEYLGRHGEWEDVHLVISLATKPDAGPFSSPNRNRLWAAANAMHTLGKGRLDQMTTLPMNDELLERVLILASDKDVRDLPDASFIKFFSSQADRVRKAALLKCIKVLTKTRIAKLLQTYLGSDQTHYYNVSHWLDMGISLPKPTVSEAAGRVISTWPR